jgi:hypothetical protein
MKYTVAHENDPTARGRGRRREDTRRAPERRDVVDVKAEPERVLFLRSSAGAVRIGPAVVLARHFPASHVS